MDRTRGVGSQAWAHGWRGWIRLQSSHLLNIAVEKRSRDLNARPLRTLHTMCQRRQSIASVGFLLTGFYGTRRFRSDERRVLQGSAVP